MRKSDLNEAVNACCCKIHAASAFMPDDEALKNKELIPSLDDMIGKKVNQGFRFREGSHLYKTKQPTYIFNASQRPSLPGFEALFEEIPDKHKGTADDPIPYNNNMELFKGMYYEQFGVVYICTAATGQAVYADLKNLVPHFVEVV